MNCLFSIVCVFFIYRCYYFYYWCWCLRWSCLFAHISQSCNIFKTIFVVMLFCPFPNKYMHTQNGQTATRSSVSICFFFISLSLRSLQRISRFFVVFVVVSFDCAPKSSAQMITSYLKILPSLCVSHTYYPVNLCLVIFPLYSVISIALDALLYSLTVARSVSFTIRGHSEFICLFVRHCTFVLCFRLV